MMDGFPFVLYHVRGCGGPCFLLSKKPHHDDLTDHSGARRLDGRIIAEGEIAFCDSCGCCLNRADFLPEYVKEL